MPLEVQFTFEEVSTDCVDISITDDGTTEPEESFTVILTAVSDFVNIGDISSSTVTIDDDDCESNSHMNESCGKNSLSTAISVKIYVEDDEFNEEDGMGLVCVQISAGQLDGITATVALTTSDVSALSPGEILPLKGSKPLTFFSLHS